MTVNDRLLEAIMRHRHFVLRAENGVIGMMIAPLQEALREVRAELAKMAKADGATGDFRRFSRLRLMEMERRLDRIIALAFRAVIAAGTPAFRDFAMREGEIQVGLLTREVPNALNIDVTGPDLQRVERTLLTPVGGKTWATRMAATYGSATMAMKSDLATSAALGESFADATRRMQKSLVGVTRWKVARIVRTEMQRVATSVAMESYQSNADLLKGVKIVETLDDRTCLLCASKDGQVLDLNDPDIPPYHPGCRGFPAPITRSLEELGIANLRWPEGTRASMDGQVPASLSYPEWFAKQPASFQLDVLGPARYKLYRSGGLPLDRMVADGRILTLAELPARSLAA